MLHSIRNLPKNFKKTWNQLLTYPKKKHTIEYKSLAISPGHTAPGSIRKIQLVGGFHYGI